MLGLFKPKSIHFVNIAKPGEFHNSSFTLQPSNDLLVVTLFQPNSHFCFGILTDRAACDRIVAMPPCFARAVRGFAIFAAPAPW
jgi:hypothetical protein